MAVRLAIAAFFFYALVCGARLAQHGWDPSDLVRFGTAMPQTVERAKIILPRLHEQEDVGHDGMQFWTLARDPLLLHPDDTKMFLDRPTYRARRMLYPFLCAPWRIGGEELLLWGMIATNLIAVGIGTFASVRLMEFFGANARGAIGFALNPGVAFAVFIDGCDALALACLVLFLLAVVREKWWHAIAFAALAALTKEPSLIAIAGALIVVKKSLWTRAQILLIPTLVTIAWAVYAQWRLGASPSHVREFGIPFAGYVASVRYWISASAWPDFLVGTLVVALSIAIVVRFVRKRTLLLGAALPFALMTPLLSFDVYSLMHNIARAFAPAFTFLWMDYYVQRDTNLRQTPYLPIA